MPQLQPFWNSRYTVADPGPYVGPLYATNPWDTAVLRGVRVPGVVSVPNLKRQRHLWTIQAAGAAPVPIKAGYEPLKFPMTVKVWTPEQWEKLQPIMWMLLPVWVKPTPRAQRGKTKSEDPNAAFDITHPMCSAANVNACICEDFSMSGEGQIRTLTIQFLEYRRGKSAVATVNQAQVNAQFNPTDLANQQVRTANGNVMPYTPTQGPQQKPSQAGITLTPTS